MTTRKVRPATWADCLFFRRCYNLSSSSPVGLWEHLMWWVRTNHEQRYICEQEGTGKRYGYIRVDGSGVVSVAVLPQFRRMGVGRQLLLAVTKRITQRNLAAWIDIENVASQKLFESCGFVRREYAAVIEGRVLYLRKGK